MAQRKGLNPRHSSRAAFCERSALYLRSVCVTNTALHGLKCHPLICMLLKLRLKVDSTPTRFRIFSALTCRSPEFDPFPLSHFGGITSVNAHNQIVGC
jgi:hypothetical protein